MSDYYNQDRIDRSAEERREGLNVLRFILVFVFLVPVAIGIRLTVDRIMFPVVEVSNSGQRTVSLSYLTCFVIPATLLTIVIVGLFLRGIFASFAERREHRQLVRERHDREREAQPKPAPAPIRQEPKAKVLHAPAKKQPIDLSAAVAYQKEVDERRARQSIHAKLMAAKREAARQKEREIRETELKNRIKDNER